MNTKFLVELIEKNTRVILPEFGAFLVKDDGTGTYKNSNVTFSPFLRYNDGMVEDALASAKKISKDEAKKQLNRYIEDIKSKLLNEKSLAIENLGLFKLDKRGSVHFVPKDLAENDQIDGKEEKKDEIQSEEIKEVKQKPQAKEVKPPAQDTPLKATPDKTEEEKSEPKKESETKPEIETKVEKAAPKVSSVKPQKTTPTPPIQKQQKVTKSSSGTGKAILIGTLIGLGLVVIVVGGWYLISSGIIDFSKKEVATSNISQEVTVDEPEEIISTEESEVTQGQFDNEFEKLSNEIDNQSLADDKGESKSTIDEKRIIDNKSAQDVVVNASYPQDGMFHIIAGSFRNPNYAEKFSNDMKSAGFKSRVILQPSGMHAVSLGSFLTRQEAADSMNVWKMQYPNVWLLKQ